MSNKLKSTSDMKKGQNGEKTKKIPKVPRVGRDLSVLLNWLTTDNIQALAAQHGITPTQVYNRLRGRSRTKYSFLKDVMAVVRENRKILDEVEQLEREERRVAV